MPLAGQGLEEIGDTFIVFAATGVGGKSCLRFKSPIEAMN